MRTRRDLVVKVQATSFRSRSPSDEQLEDLLLIELAVRDQAGLNEQRKRVAKRRSSTGFTANMRALARAEGWDVEPSVVDAAVRRLTAAHFLVTDRDPGHPGRDGCRARLSAAGYARAADIAPTYLGGALRSFEADDVVFEGIGQVQVEFLGNRYVVGCVAGDEGSAIRHAHRFEVDTGEVLKAVTGDLDQTRAMLMAGVLAYERIEELEAEPRKVPAADRIVSLDHNRPDYLNTMAALDQLIEMVRESNSYREQDAADQERRLSELEAGRHLLGSRWVSAAAIKAAFWGTLGYLALKFVDAPIGEAASLAWSAIKKLIGL
jgi:cell division protein ZapA (FtsZ GTPase activity inhibitor)